QRRLGPGRREEIAEDGGGEALVVEALEGGELRAARLVGPGRQVRLLVPGEQADGAVEVAELLHPGQERGEGEAHPRVIAGFAAARAPRTRGTPWSAGRG